MEFLEAYWLDMLTTILGLIYIWLEYRASIVLWVVGIIMPALDIYLYYSHGLYGDAGMACYYTIAAVYGYIVWSLSPNPSQRPTPDPSRREGSGEHEVSSTVSELPITHMPLRLYLPVALFFFAAWGATYYVLVTWTNSTVPVLDAFTNALSFVGLWALAHKYIEQWFFWMLVDAVCCVLYVQKGIPFKAGLYGLYVIIAIAGYFKWKQLSKQSS
jgi:nicotinamide mononucleotide transporter